MIITSRSGTEYRAMFGLTEASLAGRAVLDCCAGGSGFVAATGDRAVAVDPAYALDRELLVSRVSAAAGETDQILGEHAGDFDWSWFGSAEARTRLRSEAAGQFLADFSSAPPGRYVAGALPNLPFASSSFDLVLCSHLLFTWSDTLDAAWHESALLEMARVSRNEVRVFPTVVQGTGAPVPFLASLRVSLEAAGHRTRVVQVPYRFQRDANEMLVISA